MGSTSSSPVVGIIVDMVYMGLEKFGRYYSEYRGFVVSNDDPSKYGRLQITVPGIIDNPTENWVYGTGQYSGKDYGSQNLPQPGDMIFVTFELGDPNRPLWKHGHFGKGDIPVERQDPNIHWFRTPKGLTVELDDTKEEIRISDTYTNKVVLSDKGISFKTEKEIFLGDLERGEDTLTLGNLTADLLKKQNDALQEAFGYIKTISEELSSLSTQMASSGAPAALMIKLAAIVPPMVVKLNAANAKGIASNKSIEALTKDIPKIKSTKVKVHE